MACVSVGAAALMTSTFASSLLARLRWRLRLALQHLHRGGDAAVHSVECISEDRDLVLAAHLELGDVQLTLADLVSPGREETHRPDHRRVQHRVQDDQREEPYQDESHDELPERLVGHLNAER